MNGRIALLAIQASDSKTGWLDREKFAELIIRECAAVVESKSWDSGCGVADAWATPQDILEHFGVKG